MDRPQRSGGVRQGLRRSGQAEGWHVSLLGRGA
jgi:hypothetical protein